MTKIIAIQRNKRDITLDIKGFVGEIVGSDSYSISSQATYGLM